MPVSFYTQHEPNSRVPVLLHYRPAQAAIPCLLLAACNAFLAPSVYIPISPWPKEL